MISPEADNTPIVSSLLEEEPDIADLLQEFTDRLPAMVEAIRSSLERLDKDELASQIHNLKGVSGNYGYTALFELSQEMEFEIQANHLNCLFEVLDRVEKIIERIRLGLSENFQPVNRNQDQGATE